MSAATCRSCLEPSALGEWFDSARASWPEQQWLLVTCPKCEEQQHLRVTSGSVRLGTLVGAPGPVFVADGGAVADEDVVVEAQGTHLRIAFQGRVWTIAARS
jgi:hypothetical protein